MPFQPPEEQEALPESPPLTHRDLIGRVMASSGLSRSPRLRQLLDYLLAQSLEESTPPPTEEQIGVAVFGRAHGYDTSVDTIVRVEISKLRKKLEHYFLDEGRDEAIVLELPRRSYGLVFHPRETAPSGDAGQAEARSWWRSYPLWIAASALFALIPALIAAAAWWWPQSWSGAPGMHEAPATRYRDHFWSNVFEENKQTQLVTSDGMAMMLGDLLHRPVTLAEYIGSGYPANLIDANIADPAVRAVFTAEMSNHLTSMPDLRAATRISQIAASRGVQLNIMFARDFRYQPQNDGSLILLSHRKANPWVSLFDGRLNFRYEFHAPSDILQNAAILNLSPLPGEDSRYPVSWGSETYAVIAYQRKPVGRGAVLMITGADVGSVEAGCDLLSDETRLRSIYDQLGIQPKGELPGFEILLRAKLLRSSVLEYTLVAHRLMAEESPSANRVRSIR
ncbi:MAG: hypothetical protein IT169_10685 [Bryobacterales bacterium]|nr:hypothetical protein [Bryobacterales bacterium]